MHFKYILQRNATTFVFVELQGNLIIEKMLLFVLSSPPYVPKPSPHPHSHPAPVPPVLLVLMPQLDSVIL